MEQRHLSGKSQWYHETQSRNQHADVLPLVPEAAHVADRFLLDLLLPEDVSTACHEWLSVSSQIAKHLFPDAVALTRLHTFSVYERLSTALTVAQVSGVQRLCNHYAARLAPLPGPDSSRESNHRLAQITQYARQLAGSPSVICAHSRQQLDAVGLTAPDIVLISQIVGFVGYQARAIAAGQALQGHPVRWIPGMPMLEDAPASLFCSDSVVWKAGPEAPQSAESDVDPFSALLAWDTTLLALENKLLAGLLPTDEQASAIALVNARLNGSPVCFYQHATAGTLAQAVLEGGNALQAWGKEQPSQHALLQAVLMLTRAPDRFGPAQTSPLEEQGFSQTQTFTLLAWSGFNGWFNRLRIGLGEAMPVT